MNQSQLELFNKKLDRIFRPAYLNWTMYLMLISFFYNLPVVKYSISGSNELRLYDLLGLVVFYTYFQNYQIINLYISHKLNFKRLHQFLFWANITLIGTVAFSFFYGRILWIIQTILYLYHFWTFFLAAILLAIMMRDQRKYNKVIYLLLILIIVEAIIVILQNLGVLPFLWNDAYKKAYFGFLSGTMGPNKIVLGMTMLISFTACVGLYFEKRIRVNKYLILGAMIASLVVIAMTGSRTSYLGLVVFAIYFMFTKTVKFIYFAGVLTVFAGVAIINDFEIVEVITNVFDGRVINKISDPTILKDGDVDVSQLYEDLGSGRKTLSLVYIEYLFSNPYVIPFGLGFNNRLTLFSSAHNTYLSLINEVGLVGVFLYFRWLLSYFRLNMSKTKFLRLSLNGLIFSMLVTLFFGEHLYVYRPLFGLVGFFLFITVILTTPRFYSK